MQSLRTKYHPRNFATLADQDSASSRALLPPAPRLVIQTVLMGSAPKPGRIPFPIWEMAVSQVTRYCVAPVPLALIDLSLRSLKRCLVQISATPPGTVWVSSRVLRPAVMHPVAGTAPMDPVSTPLLPLPTSGKAAPVETRSVAVSS